MNDQNLAHVLNIMISSATPRIFNNRSMAHDLIRIAYGEWIYKGMKESFENRVEIVLKRFGF